MITTMAITAMFIWKSEISLSNHPNDPLTL